MYLRRKTGERHFLYKTPNFPKRFAEKSPYRYRVVLGVGGNVGDTRRRMERLLVFLRRTPRLALLSTGSILRNPPFGYLEQNDFDNTVIAIATPLSPRRLLRVVWNIEKRFGRKRSFPNAPRTLDLDILFFEDRVVQYKELTIPHPCWRERVSVTVPLQSLGAAGKTLRRRYENPDI